MALSLAEGAVDSFSNDLEEDQTNRTLVPQFKALVEQIRPKIAFEKDLRAQREKEEEEEYLRNMDPNEAKFYESLDCYFEQLDKDDRQLAEEEARE